MRHCGYMEWTKEEYLSLLKSLTSPAVDSCHLIPHQILSRTESLSQTLTPVVSANSQDHKCGESESLHSKSTSACY